MQDVACQYTQVGDGPVDLIDFKKSRINAQLARVRSEETAQRPPDVEALEEDKEKLEEEISDLDVTLSKLEEKHQAVAEVNLAFLSLVYLFSPFL